MCLVFENCRFNRATNVSKEVTEFTIMIQRNSGNFEVSIFYKIFFESFLTFLTFKTCRLSKGVQMLLVEEFTH